MENFEMTGNKGVEYERPAPGVVAGKCINVVDGRYIKNIYMGQDKGWSRKIFIVWEIDQRHTQGELAGKHMVLAKEYTFSIAEKAILRIDLESWRGRAFEERRNADGTVTLLTKVKVKDQIQTVPFKVDMLINADCLLFLEHKQSAKGGTFTNIKTVMPFQKDKYQAVNREMTPNYVPDWLAKRITERPVLSPAKTNQQIQEEQNNNSNFIADDEDMPF